MNDPVPDAPDSLKRLYPFEPKSLELSCGHSMSYLDEGSGPAVLMVHGNPTWSFYYRRLVLKLRDRFRCVAPDHVGCGLSHKPRSGYSFTLAQRLEDLGELADRLELERFDLVVHDWGGAIGIGMALGRLARLRRLVVSNTAAFADARLPWRIAACRWPVFGRVVVQGLNGFAWPATRLAVRKRPLSSDVRQGFLFPYRSWSSRRALYQFVRDIPMRPGHRSWESLKRVEGGLPRLERVPAILLWGGLDFCFDDHYLARWREALPQASVLRYPDAGHYLLEDEPEEACEAIDQFLSRDA